MSIVDFASPMKVAIRLATSLICAVRSGVAANGSRCRNITSMAPSANDVVSSVIEVLPSSIALVSSHLRRVTRGTRSAVQTTPDELVPCSLGIVGVGKKIEIGSCYHSFLDERRKIDDATPIR